jgi:hypothetical protein
MPILLEPRETIKASGPVEIVDTTKVFAHFFYVSFKCFPSTCCG